jgi:membrane protease YdiL (CAAX protease family)
MASRARALSSLALMVLMLLPLPGWIFPGAGLTAQALREAVLWVLTAVLVVYVLQVERRPLASIGLKKPTWKTWTFGVVGGLVMVAAMATIYLAVFPALGVSSTESAMQAVMATPFWLRLIVVVRAAVFEELLFRGFMIERLAEITGSRALAAILAAVVFTLAHLSFWGWIHIPIAACGALVLTLLYLWRRDLVCNMTAHFVTDGIGFLLG